MKFLLFIAVLFLNINLVTAQTLLDDLPSTYILTDYFDQVKKLQHIKRIEVWQHDYSKEKKKITSSKATEYDLDQNAEVYYDYKDRKKTKALQNKLQDKPINWNDPIQPAQIGQAKDDTYDKYYRIKMQRFPKDRMIRKESYDSLINLHSGATNVTHTVTKYVYDENHMLTKEQTFQLPSYDTKREVAYTYDGKKRLVRMDKKAYYGNGKSKHEIEQEVITIYNYYTFGKERLFVKQKIDINQYITHFKNWSYKYEKNKTRLTYEESTLLGIDKFIYDFMHDNTNKLTKIKVIKNTRYPFREGDWIEYKYVPR